MFKKIDRGGFSSHQKLALNHNLLFSIKYSIRYEWIMKMQIKN